MKRMPHLDCADGWYSCPLALDWDGEPIGAVHPDAGMVEGVCRCGASEINEYIEKLEETVQVSRSTLIDLSCILPQTHHLIPEIMETLRVVYEVAP